MFPLPPYPGWDGLHPLVIHFPIALLLVAPIFIVLGLVSQRRIRGFFLAGFLMLLLGTVSAFVAVQTGKAAGELADRTPEISTVLERHEELAETTLIIFNVLLVGYALLLFAPRIFKKRLPEKVFITAHVVFLLGYTAGILVLANTAHNGGRLVHEYGVHSIVEDGQPSGETNK